MMFLFFVIGRDIGRIMENVKELIEIFFGKYFGMFNILGIYYNG